jgi:hypothetical protein
VVLQARFAACAGRDEILYQLALVSRPDGVVRAVAIAGPADGPDHATGDDDDGKHERGGTGAVVASVWEASYESMQLHPVFQWTGVAPQREVW